MTAATPAPFEIEDSLVLRTALDSMSYAFSVWTEDLRLAMFNETYADLYFEADNRPAPGADLETVCRLAVQAGTHGDQDPVELARHYRERFVSEEDANNRGRYRRELKGRTIVSTHVRVPGIGWIVTHEDETDQARAEALAADQERRLGQQNLWLATAVDNMAHGLCMFGGDRRLIICNRVYQKMYRLPDELVRPGTLRDDVIAYRASMGFDAVPADPDMRATLGRVEDTGTQRDREVLETENGRLILVLMRYMDDGGWVSTHLDVTEQYEHNLAIGERNAALQQQAERFSAAVNNMAHGLAMYDADARLVVCNGPYRTMYGLSDAEAAPGTSFWDIQGYKSRDGMVSTLDPDERRAELEKVIAAGETVKEPVHMANGRIISFSFHPLADGGWLSVHEDITEQHRLDAEIAARNREIANQFARFEAAVSNMGQGLSMFDGEARLVICNGPYRTMYGLSDDEARPGTSFWDILEVNARIGMVSIADSDERRRMLEQVIADGKPVDGPIRMINGRIMSISHHPMADGGWLSVHEDITEQHRHDAEIAARNREIERQFARFDAAVSNMSQGLSMFDSEERLVICNQAYRELYQIPDPLTRAGTSFWDIFEHRIRLGLINGEPDQARSALRKLITERRESREPVKMADGRVVMVWHRPMDDGGWVSTHEDITEDHEAEQMVRYLARHDALTELPNRTAFRARVTECFRDGQNGAGSRPGRAHALMYLDLDRFKPVNDSFGHAAGDQLLKLVAARLKQASAGRAFVSRLGGDEFALLVSGEGEAEIAAELADRILNALVEPYLIDGRELTIGASIGIAVGPRDGADPDTLMRNADIALYRAKTERRGSAVFFQQGMDERQRRRRAIEAGLRAAIGNGELALRYQPLVGISDNAIGGCEALMSWRSPDLGALSPGEFIPIAEESGQIREMGRWALDEACRVAATWPSKVSVSVNVSPVQFAGGTLVDDVRHALSGSGLAPARLVLEITESLFLADSDANLETLHQIKALGVKVALDDFGVGYSSLNYLRSFPFDKVKIDRVFTLDLVENPQTRAIVKTVLDLSRILGMTTLIEGVETEDQLRVAMELGCEEAQGFLFSPALPEGAIAEMLARTPGAAGSPGIRASA